MLKKLSCSVEKLRVEKLRVHNSCSEVLYVGK